MTFAIIMLVGLSITIWSYTQIKKLEKKTKLALFEVEKDLNSLNRKIEGGR